MSEEETVVWDKKLSLDHILTWLVTGVAAGVISSLLWVQSVDRRLQAVEQAQIYQRERDQKQDADLADVLNNVKEQIHILRADVRDIASKLDRKGER